MSEIQTQFVKRLLGNNKSFEEALANSSANLQKYIQEKHAKKTMRFRIHAVIQKVKKST